MHRKRRQIPPQHVAAEKFYTARLEHQSKQQPTQQPKNNAAGRRFSFQIWQELDWRKKKREETGLQQKYVPLESQEVATHHAQRKVYQPQQKQTWRRSNADDQQQGKGYTHTAKKVQKTIARAHPTQRGQLMKATQPHVPLIKVLFRSFHHLRDGQNPFVTDQSDDLCPEREECDQINETKQP